MNTLKLLRVIKVVLKVTYIKIPITKIKYSFNFSYLSKQFAFTLFLFIYARSPPFSSLFYTKRKEKNMKNDYKRKDFKEVKENNNKNYYIYIKNNWIKVSYEVFKICKSSYEKIYYENKRDYDKVLYFENIDLAVPYLSDWDNDNYIEQIYHQDLIKKLNYAISTLSKEEKMLIHNIYFEEMTEQQIAKILNISQATIHYRKQKILKELKFLLLNTD